MRYTRGSVLQFTLDDTGRVAWFKAKDGETWTEPVIGWAIVVWTDEETDSDIGTGIRPVILDDGHPVTVNEYLLDRDNTVYGGIRRAS